MLSIPNARVLFVAKTHREVEFLITRSTIGLGIGGTVYRARGLVTFPNGSTIRMVSVSNESDSMKLAGLEITYAFVSFDIDYMSRQFVRSRVRSHDSLQHVGFEYASIEKMAHMIDCLNSWKECSNEYADNVRRS